MTSRRIPLAPILGGLFAASVALAQPPEDAAAFATHLEFSNYTVETGETSLTATHETNLNMILKAYKGGVLLQTWVETSEKKKKDVTEVINKLNTNAIAARYYLDGEGDTMIEAWFPGGYDKKRFGTFLEAWHADTMGQSATLAELLN